VRLSLRKRLLRFDFEGSLELTFADSTATYIMKGFKGLLIVAFTVDGNRLVSRASADLVERFLGRKLEELARGFGLAVSRFAESHSRVSEIMLPLGRGEFYLRELTGEDVPHLLRYLRFATGRRDFEIQGEGSTGRFLIRVRNDFVESVEHENSSGSAIIEVNKPLLEIDGEDFLGLEVSGEQRISLR
jgi:hypothetical protein